MKNYKIAICMSTYNGQKYVKEQIESLLEQHYKNITIYVRDDGSKDGTLEILEEYDNIRIIKGENVGVVNSFYKCLKYALEDDNYDFFAYCDQDDKWHKDKITRAVSMLSNEDERIPVLYFSEFNYCDERLTFCNKSNLNKRGASFENSLLECISFGIVEVFNKSLAEEIIKSGTKNVCFHDWWAYMIATGIGKTLYDNTATVEYRRTGNNVSPSGKRGMALMIYRIKKFLFGGYFSKVKLQINKYKEIFLKRLDNENTKKINLFTTKYNFFKAIKKAFYPCKFRQSAKDELFCRILFIFGLL